MEIQDKSKGDFISKGVVILQTSWFVMQCIARGVQGLPITELELATIAFASLNFVIYVLWWDKPLNVRCGVRVYKKRITGSPVDDGQVLATAGFWAELGNSLSNLPATIVQGPLVEDAKFSLDNLPWLARVLTWPIIRPLDIIVGGTTGDLVGKRVATFYPRDWDGDWGDMWPLAMVIVGIASAFGGIHCIGWSFAFPSSTERTLWRVASVSITSVPIALFLFAFPIESDWGGTIFRWIILCCSGLSLILYVLSRLVLLMLSFLTLRSLPPAAYHMVHWTSFIPHI